MQTKLKSPLLITPVLATRTARPVIPPKEELVCEFKKVDPAGHDSGCGGHYNEILDF